MDVCFSFIRWMRGNGDKWFGGMMGKCNGVFGSILGFFISCTNILI